MSEEEKVEAPQEEAAEKDVQSEGEDLQKTITSSLDELSDAPTKEQIEVWKAQFGEVFVSGFSEKELVVWRPVKRVEYLAIQEAVQEGKIDQPKSEETLLDVCVLFSSLKMAWGETKGGVVPTLVEQVMQASNFIAPAAASMFVVKL